ncbi:MAG: cytochrome c-type biogenesis protein CcmH, partial [Deltaproteobacteria bacterium]|nr:cytochrome c-type biogenesis protein CcmH [Deltaproteobacteria bacterium]
MGYSGKFFYRPPRAHHLQTCRRHPRRAGAAQNRRSLPRHRQRPRRPRRLSGSALRPMRFAKLFVLYVLFLLCRSPLLAATPDLEDRTREIATELRCVVCQNLSVADSPSEMAQQMRAIVREQVQAGKSAEQIKEFFVSKYGEWVLLKPKTTGFSALLWILPYVFLALGIIAALWFVRRWSSKKKSTAESAPLIEAESKLLRQNFVRPDIEDSSSRAQLLRERGRLRDEIGELEFDYQSGKISEGDYRAL